jgi:hypothetical protein
MAANVDLSAVKVGFDSNGGSIDLVGVRDGVITPSENTPQKNKGAEINIGIFSYETGTKETDNGETTTIEDKISVGVSIFEFYHTNTTEVNNSTDQSTTTTEEGVKAKDINVKASFLFGVELGLDVEKLANALHNLLKTD